MSQKIIDQVCEILSTHSIAKAHANLEFDANRETLLKSLDAHLPAPLPNLAVERCERAWKRAYKTAVAAKKDSYDSEQAANLAFRKAMPMLDSFEHVRDFIACTTYALLLDIINELTATKLMYAAQIASAMYRKSAALAQPRSDTQDTKTN